MRRIAVCMVLAIGFAACNQTESEESNDLRAADEIAATEVPANSAHSSEPGEPGGLPDDRDLVEEGPIDPKGAQGAGQVLQSYAALLEQRRFSEARRLWTEAGAGSGLDVEGFDETYGKYSEIHAEIGAPGAIEGAAGSAYVDIPLRLYGTLKSGRPFNSVGSATLRRVNDVPGSTEEQRRWRIYRLDMQPPP